MKKIYSFFSALLVGTACLFAQTAPDGYIAKGAFTESFTDASTVSKMGWGWGWQAGDPSKSYKTGKSYPVNGQYILYSDAYAAKDQTTPTLLITPLLKGNISFKVSARVAYSPELSNLTDKKSFVRLYAGHMDGDALVWDDEPFFTHTITELPTNITTDADYWTTCNTSVDDYQFIGIQLSYICFDELTADDYCLPIKHVMTPTAVASEWNSSNNPLYGDAEGKTTWTGSVTVQNNGDLPFADGEAVLTITSSNTSVTTTTFTSFTIPDAIPAGESKTYDISVPLQLVDLTKDGYTAIKFTSNLDNFNASLPYKQSAWFDVKAYAPKLTVRNASNSDVTSYATALGLVEAPASTTFTLKNDGGSPLVLKSITSATMSNLAFTCEGAEGNIFPLTIERGTDTTITMTFGNTGGQSGTLVFTYGNNYDTTKYTLESKEVSAVVADPALYLEQFGATLPQGWVNEEGSNWSISSTSTNYYMTNSQQGAPGKYLISPKLRFEEGQTLAIMAQRKGSSGSSLRVLTSTDRLNWTLALEKTTWTKSYSGSLNTSYTELVAVPMPEGDVYVAFEAGYSIIDYVLGGTKVAVEDDIYTTISGADNAMVNYPYELGVELQNLTERVYNEKTLVLELLNGSEVVATDTIDAMMGALENISGLKLTFTPHAANDDAVLTLNINKAGTTILSLKKNIRIAEEVYFTDIQTGEVVTSNSNSNIPLRTNYKNSKSEFILPAKKFKEFTKDTALTSITFFYRNTSKNITADSVRILLQNTTDSTIGSTLTFTEEKDMTKVVSLTKYAFAMAANSSSFVELTFSFSEPFVYTGKNLRVMMVSEKQDVYGSTSWASETVSDSVAIYKSNDTYDKYNEKATGTLQKVLPIIKFGYKASTPTISGNVNLKSGNNAGRTITAKSGDVLYQTTTDASGNYSLEIMQVTRLYDIYLDDECKAQNISVEAGNTVVNITDIVTNCEQTMLNAPAATKHIINGMLIIQRGDKLYNANGQVLK